jgi:hypothetical protein
MPRSKYMPARNTEVVKLMYSYSHKDEALRGELERHLAILKRSGVIQSWYDRNIEAGTDWSKEIDDQINQADVILLLISADFLASDYCHEIEMKRALERDRAGEARVIPVILRAVDWAGAQFARLHTLPTDGRPVTSWSNTDEAFTDIARGIRRAVEGLKGTQARPPLPDSNSRRIIGLLQAAVPSKVPVGHSRDVVAMLAAENSVGLREALVADDAYISQPDDVRSQRFVLRVEAPPSGTIAIPAMIRLRSPEFEPAEQQVETEVSDDFTGPVLAFLVKARKGGTQLLSVDLLVKNRLAGTRILRTEAEEANLPPGGGGTGAVAPPPPPPPDWTVVASLAMTVVAYAEAQRLRFA